MTNAIAFPNVVSRAISNVARRAGRVAQPRSVAPHGLAQGVAQAAGLERDLARVKTVAAWLDTRFSFLGYRFGLDTVLGLVPVAGDTVAALIGLYPIWVAYHYRLGRGLLARMGLNLLLEWLIGLVPLIGDLFDTVFKANVRNARLLERAVCAPAYVPRPATSVPSPGTPGEG